MVLFDTACVIASDRTGPDLRGQGQDGPIALIAVLQREIPRSTFVNRMRGKAKRVAGELVRKAWDHAIELGAIGPGDARGKRFGHFGMNSVICFPANTLFNEAYIHIGEGTMFGPQITLSAGMVPGQECLTNPVVKIGDRCLIGKGSGIVGHLSIEIGNDVWTGHHVYITDQNDGYDDLTQPISRQSMPERPATIDFLERAPDEKTLRRSLPVSVE